MMSRSIHLTRMILAGAAAVCLLASPAVAQKSKSTKSAEFVWTVRNPDGDPPKGKLSIRIAGKTRFIANFIGSINKIEAESYKEQQIPANATHAVSTWWAGGGDKYFVVPAQGRFYVKTTFIQEAPEEGIPPTGTWKTIAVFSSTGKKIK